MRRPSFISWEQLRVGLVLVLGVAVLSIAMAQLGKAANLFSDRYVLVTFLREGAGLREGGSVTLAGQLVGTISRIEFLPPDADTTRTLRVTMEVDQALRDQIRLDSRARLRTLGLLGDKVIDISPGTPAGRPLVSGDTIRLAEGVDYEAVIAQASSAVEDLVALAADMRVLSGKVVAGEGTVGKLLTDEKLYVELASTLEQTDRMLARLQSRNGTVGRLLDDPALYDNLNRTLASLDSLVGQVNRSEGTVGKLLRDDSLYRSMVRVTSGADTLVHSLTHGNGLAAKLITDQALYDQLLKAVTDLNAILGDVRKDPTRYTRGLIKVF